MDAEVTIVFPLRVAALAFLVTIAIEIQIAGSRANVQFAYPLFAGGIAGVAAYGFLLWRKRTE